MGLRGKYEPLTEYLMNSHKDEVTLPINEISSIVSGGLPAWVYNLKRQPWSKSINPVGSLSAAWLNAGYVVKDHTTAIVTFKKYKAD